MVKRKKRKTLIKAKPENYFILVTGVPLKSLKELTNVLENMNQWVFDHHVNNSRNDFADWIKNVLKEDDLSKDIHRSKDIKEMEYVILKHLVNRYL